MSKVEIFLKELSSVSQIMMLYPQEHPKSQSAIKGVYAKLEDCLKEYNELTIGIVKGELIFGKDVFFELSNKLRYLIGRLSDKGIEKIIFRRGVTKEETARFINALIKKKDEAEDFAKYFNSLGIENISIGKIKVGGEDKSKVEFIEGYDYSLRLVSDSFKSIFRGEPVDALYAKKAIENTLGMLLKGNWNIVMLTEIKRYDLITFAHSLNVGTLAAAFASELSFNRDAILNIGIAGLFHDIGKIAISQKIINKPGALTDEEFASVKSHTVLGAEMLIQQVDSLGILPVLIAFEHHLRYDLKGYPKLRYPKRPHFISLAVSLCDYYDALRSRRSYKKDYPPRKIYEIMLEGRGKMFEPSLFDNFFNFVGVYPVSTIVELDKGQIGIVREQNKGSIFSPRIEIVYPDRERGSMVNLKNNSYLRIKNSLNPLLEGKKYVPLI